MESTSNISGRDKTTHIPPMPLWVVIIRIVQAVLAIVVLGLAAYVFNIYSATEKSAVNTEAYDFSYAGVGGFSLTGCRMVFFAFSWTVLYLLYIGVTLAFINEFYNMWAHLGLEILTCLWWLISFALLASDASNLDTIENYKGYGYGYGYGASLNDYLPQKYKTALGCEKGAAGLGALEWLLFVITLVIFGIALHKHRKNHAIVTAPAATNGAAMTEEHKMDSMVTTQAVPVQAVPVQDPRYAQYQQQQYQQQQMA